MRKRGALGTFREVSLVGRGGLGCIYWPPWPSKQGLPRWVLQRCCPVWARGWIGMPGSLVPPSWSGAQMHPLDACPQPACVFQLSRHTSFYLCRQLYLESRRSPWKTEAILAWAFVLLRKLWRLCTLGTASRDTSWWLLRWGVGQAGSLRVYTK